MTDPKDEQIAQLQAALQKQMGATPIFFENVSGDLSAGNAAIVVNEATALMVHLAAIAGDDRAVLDAIAEHAQKLADDGAVDAWEFVLRGALYQLAMVYVGPLLDGMEHGPKPTPRTEAKRAWLSARKQWRENPNHDNKEN